MGITFSVQSKIFTTKDTKLHKGTVSYNLLTGANLDDLAN